MKNARWLLAGALTLGLLACKQDPKPRTAAAAPVSSPSPSCSAVACPEGQVCASGGCRACAGDGECGADQKCCAGRCEFVECCGPADCAGRLCQAGSCQPCSADAQCGAGSVCCSGLCHAGACCADAQCPGGQRCQDHQCGACTNDGECGSGGKCCAGACVKGACCVGAECPSGLCDRGQCTACTADAQCGANKVCCKGACVLDGTCELGLRLDCSPACPLGRLCCDGKCLLAQCCTDTDCAGYPSAPLCIDGACQKCTADAQCPVNTKCCDGACHPGACCPGQVCPQGKACLAYSCSDCNIDSDCGQGKRCCDQGGGTKACTSGGCCTNDDCVPYICLGGQCGTCGLDADCAKGAKCCGGVCYAGATCCARADCPGGQVCSTDDHKCVGCINGRQCGLGARCCGNTCSLGSCCSNDDCNTATTGLVCNDGACQLCSTDAQCGGAGHRCCSGKCTTGCCSDADCGSGQKCTNGACGTCTYAPADAGAPDLRGTCGFGQVCCATTKPGQLGCLSGSCCTNADCTTGGLVCDANTCKQCTAVVNASGQYVSSDCSPGARCCSGACYPGVTCCSDTDCPGQRCVNGACATCKVDLDCGGGMSCCPANDPTQGLLCKAFCQTKMTTDLPVDWNNGTYDGTSQTGGTQPDGVTPLDPDCTNPTSGKLCLSGHQSTSTTNYIWIPVTDRNAVYHYNADTLQLLSTTSVVGTDPSRTAVNTNDNSLWIGSRGFSGPANSGINHIGADGKLICWAGVPQYARAITIDNNGDIWAGQCGNGTMYKFSGSQVNAATNPPTCVSLGISVSGGPCAYGAATDSRNHIWVANIDSGISEFDATSATFLRSITGIGTYGMTVDQDYAWVGACYSAGVFRCKLTGSETDGSGCDFVPTGGCPRGLSVSPDHFVYAGLNNSVISVIDRNNPSSHHELAPKDDSGHGFSCTITTAVDGAGRVWVIDYSASKAVRYEKGSSACTADSQCPSNWCWAGVCAVPKSVSFAGSPYAYTDLTGEQSLIAHVPPGYWTGTYDSGLTDSTSQPYWVAVNLSAKIPDKTSVQLRVRAAMDAAVFGSGNPPAWSAWIPVTVTNPVGYQQYSVPVGVVDTANNAHARRFLQVEVELQTKDDTTTPVVGMVQAVWSPPDPK